MLERDIAGNDAAIQLAFVKFEILTGMNHLDNKAHPE
jgi:hypothetical protein